MPFGRNVPNDVFDDFLQLIAKDPSQGNRRFIARNFLLDEGVTPDRQSRYRDEGAMAHHATYENWGTVHNDYLDSHVFLITADTENCPETFRDRRYLQTYGKSDIGLELIRIEYVPSTQKSNDALWQAARGFLENPSLPHEQALNVALEMWQRSRDLRPVWAAYWIDVEEIFKPNPEHDSEDWPNALRDCLGLYHLNPDSRSGVKVDIMVFRYPVKELATFKGDRVLRPFAVPTVLDSNFSVAFCPAPAGQVCGYAVSLENVPLRHRREVLHPVIQFKAKHLYKIGTITQPVPKDLSDVRREHLRWVRNETTRPDYADITDGDL